VLCGDSPDTSYPVIWIGKRTLLQGTPTQETAGIRSWVGVDLRSQRVRIMSYKRGA
jgi:hypothetical protein